MSKIKLKLNKTYDDLASKIEKGSVSDEELKLFYSLNTKNNSDIEHSCFEVIEDK